MQRCMGALVVICAMLLAAACGDSDGTEPEYDAGNPEAWAACPLFVDQPDGRQAECARFEVPVRWSDPDGPTIEIFVQRLLGSAAEKRGQLWLLSGGPGHSGAIYDHWMDRFSEQAPEWDLYAVDHRGTGRSHRLNSELDPYLDGCTMSAAARDVGHLIEANADPSLETFVYGCSYGTDWAHRYAQIFPDQATGVILDSLAPNVLYSVYDSDYDLVGEDFFAYCADDLLCAEKLGEDPWTALGELLAMLDEGHCADLSLSREELRRLLAAMLWQWETREVIPALVYRLERCTADDVAAIQHLLSELDTYLAMPDYYWDLFSDFLQVNIVLSERWPDPAPSVAEMQAIVDQAYISTNWTVYMAMNYAAWPRYQPDEYQWGWAETSFPLLMMNGDLDTATPIWEATPAIDHLNGPNQYFYTFPRMAHEVVGQSLIGIDNGCGLAVMLAFLDDPTTAPAADCLASIPEIDFHDSSGFGAYLFGTEDMWENPTKGALPAWRPPPPGYRSALRELARRWHQHLPPGRAAVTL